MKAKVKKTNLKTSRQRKESKALLTFLKRTKKGEYAEIEQNSLRYSRVSEDAETMIPEDEYFYNLK